MKTLHKFILKSYIGPFVMTFFIAMFVFFMMFIFKYIDDFVGKGLGAGILSELFFYFSLTTIPMALPLAVLLSSLMTFGNLGEHFELTALKSAGLSLQKIMMPLIITIFSLALLAFYFSNNILPYTNLKAGSLLYDIRESKPALLFKDGVFNNSMQGFSIRVNKKDKDGKTLHDILIYDHRSMQGNNIVISAKRGRMEQTADKSYLVITLYDGESYKEILDNTTSNINHPAMRDKFEERILRFDISDFKLSRTNEDLFKNNYQMLNVSQLKYAIDSLKKKNNARFNDFQQQLIQSYYRNSTSFLHQIDSTKSKNTSTIAYEKLSSAEKLQLMEGASNIMRSSKAFCEAIISEYDSNVEYSLKYDIELQRKYTLSVACIVLFFIGAPLGAIIRKGGLGMPVVVSVVFFIMFHILSITGEKLVKEQALLPYQGMWMATVVLMPVGIFFTIKATTDSSLFDINQYLEVFKKLIRIKSKNKE
jgi:lipopolysaccharide export system permease protein